MPPTFWTLILTARDFGSPDAQAALGKLCETYWYPLYAFVRRHGKNHHEAQDLIQGFFEHLFQREWLNNVDKGKGRFRSFLLSSLVNFLHNEREKISTIKRGGAEKFVSWDAEEAESRQKAEPALTADPQLEYERLWALVLVEKALSALESEYSRCGKAELFRVLVPYMTRPIPPRYYAEAGERLGMNEGAMRTAMHRFLPRFGEKLRAQVADTIADQADVESELREVLRHWAEGKE